MSYCFAGMFVYTLILSHTLLDRLPKEKEFSPDFINFQHAASVDTITTYMVSIVLFFLVIKFIKLLSFNSNINLMTRSLKRSWYPLGMFAFQVFVLFIPLCMFGAMTFGTHDYAYRDYKSAFTAGGTMLLGKFRFANFEYSHRVFGPIYFLLFNVCIQMIGLNLLISIFCEAYDIEKRKKRPNDVEVLDYLVNSFKEAIGMKTVSVSMRMQKKQANLVPKNNSDDSEHPSIAVSKDDISLSMNSSMNRSKLSIKSSYKKSLRKKWKDHLEKVVNESLEKVRHWRVPDRDDVEEYEFLDLINFGSEESIDQVGFASEEVSENQSHRAPSVEVEVTEESYIEESLPGSLIVSLTSHEEEDLCAKFTRPIKLKHKEKARDLSQIQRASQIAMGKDSKEIQLLLTRQSAQLKETAVKYEEDRLRNRVKVEMLRRKAARKFSMKPPMEVLSETLEGSEVLKNLPQEEGDLLLKEQEEFFRNVCASKRHHELKVTSSHKIKRRRKRENMRNKST
jgi:hypothetical protein